MTTTKPLVLLVIILFLVSNITACGLLKNPDVKNAETLIEELGTVTLGSAEKIDAAENAYDTLDDKQKEKVENFQKLEKAKTDYLLLLAKSAYDDLNSAVSKISENMHMYKDAWHYGIYEDEDTLSVKGLADEVDISADELDAALRAIDTSEDVLDYMYEDEFSVGLWIVDEIFKIRNIFPEIKNLLSSAKDKLKTIEMKYPDYENYKALVDYYAKANSYYEFASDHNESYESFSDKVQDYEKALDDLKSPLEYTFGD